MTSNQRAVEKMRPVKETVPFAEFNEIQNKILERKLEAALANL